MNPFEPSINSNPFATSEWAGSSAFGNANPFGQLGVVPTRDSFDVARGLSALDNKEESETFSVSEVRYKPPSPIIGLVSNNNILVFALENGHIIRLNLLEPAGLEDVEIVRGQTIVKMFLDPSGTHLLLVVNNEDTYYLPQNQRRPQKLKVRGVESVAFQREVQNPSQGVQILVGTNTGQVYEGFLRDGLQRYRPVFNINTEGMNITSLVFEHFPGDETKFFTMAVTPDRIIQFVGGPSLDLALSHPIYRVLPGSLPHSQLRVFSVRGGLLTSFAWLAKPGIFHGSLVFGSQNPGDTVMSSDTDLLPYPEKNPARSMVLTEFYFILLYPNKIQAISRLTKEVEWEKNFDTTLVSLAHDPVHNLIFFFSNNKVFELSVVDEDKNVWEKYLQMNKFEEALQYAKTAAQKDQIWSKRAEYYFSSSKWELAAKCYAKSKKSFEEICLKFITVGQHDPLRTFFAL
eukprot:TRINITY_DN5700_c0_g1_i3.p1 TRINITY_DN5700_c0_g1~~TRINITY_DN5700_c0_g1_i3.p1  ORF type:complete len:460 (-),score=77.96 TRINITY_DN5700_c0_g1_i3:1658-3037(-)